MVKWLLVLFGLAEMAFPKRIVGVGEALALENPGETELRAWTIPMARIEGLTFLGLVLRGGSSYSRVGPLLGLVGVPAMLAPRRFVRSTLQLAYRDAGGITLRPWVVPATRLLGLVYVAVALRAIGKRPPPR